MAVRLLVCEWLRERDVVRKIAARGVERLSPPTRSKLVLWLDDMLRHCGINGEGEGEGDDDDDEITRLAALLRPLRLQRTHAT
jgi:hypothetical protein